MRKPELKMTDFYAKSIQSLEEGSLNSSILIIIVFELSLINEGEAANWRFSGEWVQSPRTMTDSGYPTTAQFAMVFLPLQ